MTKRQVDHCTHDCFRHIDAHTNSTTDMKFFTQQNKGGGEVGGTQAKTSAQIFAHAHRPHTQSISLREGGKHNLGFCFPDNFLGSGAQMIFLFLALVP